MNGMPNDYWGKYSKSESEESWIRLEDHLVDVAVCFETLLACGYEKPLSALAGVDRLSPEQISRLCVIALIHDIGKAIKDFQSQIFEDEKMNKRHTGHTLVACSIFKMSPEDKIRKDFLSLFSNFEKWFEYRGCEGDDCFASMLLNSWGHHGKPVEYDFAMSPNKGVSGVKWEGWEYLNFNNLIKRIDEIIETYWPESKNSNDNPIHASSNFMYEFNGLLTLSDWMASDIRYFTYDHDCASRYIFAKKMAKKMIKKSGRGKLILENKFENVFGFKRNKMQDNFMEISEKIYA